MSDDRLRELQMQITDNRETLIEIVGKDGKSGSLKELRDDMTSVAETMHRITETQEAMHRDRLKHDRASAERRIQEAKDQVEPAAQSRVVEFKTTVLWAAAAAILAAGLTLGLTFLGG